MHDIDNTTLIPSPKWFATYCKIVSANIQDKDGNVRFDYMTLRQALTAVERAKEGQVPQSVVELFRNCVEYTIKAEGQVDINDRQEVTLLLVLLNMHMAYSMISGYLLTQDKSIREEL